MNCASLDGDIKINVLKILNIFGCEIRGTLTILEHAERRLWKYLKILLLICFKIPFDDELRRSSS